MVCTLLQTEDGYLYGYVYFRQVKDRTLRRGYFQKVSQVLILNETNMVNTYSIKYTLTLILDLTDAICYQTSELDDSKSLLIEKCVRLVAKQAVQVLKSIHIDGN